MAFLGIPTSKRDVANAGWIRGATTAALRGTANVNQALGSKLGVSNLRAVADNIDNPAVNYQGIPNPVTPKPAQPVQQVKDGTFDQDPTGLGGGAYGAGGSSYDPNTDPVRINQKRAEIRGLMSMFESAFNDVLGRVDQLAAEKRGEFEQNYADQQQGLDKSFSSTSTGIDDQYGARNAFHSSYRENAQDQARDAYDTATGQLTQAKGRDLASVGQFAEQQKAELAGGRPTFNVDDYTQVDDLLSIGQDVQAAINKLNTTGSGLRTNSQYKANLDHLAPAQEQGSAQLKGMLDKLSNTGGNPDAKRAIAMSTIAKAGGDQTAWMDYFEKQMQQTGSNALVDPAASVLTQ